MATRQSACQSAAVARGKALELVSEGLRPSLLQALRAGFAVYSAFSEEERRTLKLRSRKPSSLRRLAEARGVPVSSLWRALAVYLLYRRCPQLAGYRHVGISHVSLILGLDEAAQLHFLEKVELKRWSRQQLGRELRRHSGKQLATTEALRWFACSAEPRAEG
jgi:hypothetical protein